MPIQVFLHNVCIVVESPLPKTVIASMIYFGAFFFFRRRLLNYEFNDYRIEGKEYKHNAKKNPNLNWHIQEHKLCFETFFSITL